MRPWTYRVRVRPVDAVVPLLRPDGDLECPCCSGGITTPVGWSPWTGDDQQMILVEGTAQCPHCNRQHWIPTDLAAKFNNRLYPDNPEVWRQRPNAEEAN